MSEGWISLHRSLLNWEWYDDINTTRLFIHLLLKANHKPQKWHGFIIDTGQHLISLRGLAKETKLSIRSVRTSLTKLKTTHELTQFATHGKSLITIANYSKYQTKKEGTTQFATHEPTNDRHTTDTLNNNNNNDNNNKEKIYKKEKNSFSCSTVSIPYKKIIEVFHKTLPLFPTIQILTETRKRHIKARWSEKLNSLELWEKFFIEVTQSKFLMGETDPPFKCSFDWLIKPTNFVKVWEGNFSNYR